MWQFRRRRRDLTQQDEDELYALFERVPALELPYCFREDIAELFDAAPNREAAFNAGGKLARRRCASRRLRIACPRPQHPGQIQRLLHLKTEEPDYFVVFGEKHMDHLVSEMLAYYHEERPHQSKGNDPLAAGERGNRRVLQETRASRRPM